MLCSTNLFPNTSLSQMRITPLASFSVSLIIELRKTALILWREKNTDLNFSFCPGSQNIENLLHDINEFAFFETHHKTQYCKDPFYSRIYFIFKKEHIAYTGIRWINNIFGFCAVLKFDHQIAKNHIIFTF